MYFEFETICNEDNVLTLHLDTHTDYEQVWLDGPIPQWIYKEWEVLDEQATFMKVVEFLLNNECVEFSESEVYDYSRLHFVHYPSGHVYAIDSYDVNTLNYTGCVSLFTMDEEYADEKAEALERFFSE